MRTIRLWSVTGILLIVVWTGLAAAAGQTAPVYAPVDVVVQGAVDTELQPLLAALEGKEEIQIAAWTFWRGRIAGKSVVVSRTEVGPMNVSVATALAVTHFHPRLIINQGTAGAVDPTLNVFDILAGEATVDYGAFQSTHADAGAGVDQARWTPMPHRIRLDGKERTEFRSFPGNPEAIRAALDTPNPRGRVMKGVVGSAYEFNREIDRLIWIRKTYGASSEDMESAFAAAAAVGFKTPFVAIRIISDNEFTAPEFKRIAGEYCAAFVVDMLSKTQAAAQKPAPSQDAPAQPAAAPKPGEPARDAPPEQKAYQDAVKVGDPDKKIEALKKVVADFPKSSVVEMAESQILTTLVKKAGDTIKSVQEQAKKMSGGDPGTGRGANATIASSLLNANLLLDEAETYSLKAVEALSDQQKFIDTQKKAFADRQAEALKKDPAAKPMTPPEESALANTFKSARQTALVTLAQVYDKRGKATDAEATFKAAYQLAPKGTSAYTAALRLAELAGKAGRESEQFEYLTTVALAGRLAAADRATFEALYKKAHNNSLEGLEAMLDARYAKENPPLVHVTPYVRTKDRTKRVVLAEVFTGAGCPPCAGADLAYDGAMERYTHSELAVLMYHMHIPRPDPMTNPYTLKRAEFYAIRGVPTSAVDGEAKVGGGSPDAAPKIYAETVEPAIEKRLKTPPGVKLDLKATRQGNTVKTTVSVGKAVGDAKKLRLHVALAEGKVRYSGENFVRYHPMVVRNMAMGDKDAQGFALTPGTSFKSAYEFDIQKTVEEAKAHLDDFEVSSTRFGKFQFMSKMHDVNADNLYVVAFVQNDETKEILQTAIVTLAPAKK